MGAGKAEIHAVEVEKAEVGLGAGEIQMDSLSAEKAFLQVGTGTLGVKSFKGGDLELECGVGALDINVQHRPERPQVFRSGPGRNRQQQCIQENKHGMRNRRYQSENGRRVDRAVQDKLYGTGKQ